MNVAIIPARSGSKRIKNKNVRLFHGKPIIAYSIECAINSKLFDRVVVSTDSIEIASISERYGAEVPFLRPEALSDDYTGTADVIGHAVETLNLPDNSIVVCIYATAPFLNYFNIKSALRKFEDLNPKYCFPVTEFEYPIQRAISTDNEYVKVREPDSISSRSQDLSKFYHDAGQFYVGKAKSWRVKDAIISDYSACIIIPRSEAMDIDTEEDWLLAESLFERTRDLYK